MSNYASSPTVTNCVFSGNEAGLADGGGMHNYSSSPTVTNCLFSGNSAIEGGGMFNTTYSSPKLTNCTFVNNSASNGNALGCDSYQQSYPSNVQLGNCILWDEGDEIWNNDGSSITITYSDVQGGWTGAGSNNIDADPRFVDPNGPDGIAGTEDDDLRLFGYSGCIDAGDNTAVPADTIDLDNDGDTTELIPFDLDGRPRIADGDGDDTAIVDMGAYEYCCYREPVTIYVDADANGADDGSSWEDAYNYLQDALAVAVYGDQIWVADGTYRPDANTANPGGSGERTETFQLINGVAVYGGFAGGESSLDERDWKTNETILSGDIGTPGDSSDNSYHVVTGSGTHEIAVLDGFTITAGDTTGAVWPYDRGGGMYNFISNATLVNCTFGGNTANNYGGGMYNGTAGSATVTNCILWGNTASDGNEIALSTSSTIDVNYCDVRGGQTDVYVGDDCTLNWGVGNIDADPCFAEPNGPDDIAGTEDDDLRLSAYSPCIDAGDNNSVPADTIDLDNDGNTTEPIPFDLDGNSRFIDDKTTVDTGSGTPPIVDMGAYEFLETCGDAAHPYPPVDMTGPDGVRDCRVDFFDFAFFAAYWLECTAPECQ